MIPSCRLYVRCVSHAGTALQEVSMERFTTAAEVAREVGLSPEVVRRLFYRGVLPGKVVAGRVLLEGGSARKLAKEYAARGKGGRSDAA